MPGKGARRHEAQITRCQVGPSGVAGIEEEGMQKRVRARAKVQVAGGTESGATVRMQSRAQTRCSTVTFCPGLGFIRMKTWGCEVTTVHGPLQIGAAPGPQLMGRQQEVVHQAPSKRTVGGHLNLKRYCSGGHSAWASLRILPWRPSRPFQKSPFVGVLSCAVTLPGWPESSQTMFLPPPL